MNDIHENEIKNLTLKGIPGSEITWRHISDSANNNDPYRRPGVRYFAIKLDDEFAEELEQQGWPVIWRNIKRGDDDSVEIMQAYLKVFIKYGTRYPVDIYLVSKDRRSKIELKESDLDSLYVDTKLESIDVTIRPYHWVYGNDSGVKAQVRAMNILLAQDGLDDDYEIIYQK